MKKDNTYSISIFYADNEPYQVGLTLSLEYLDWCQMKEEPFFPQLKRFLERKGIQERRGGLFSEGDLLEKAECDTGYPPGEGFS